MQYIKRYFDAGAAEPAAPMSIAEAMAKFGVQNNTDSPVATPIEIKEEKKEETVTEPVVTPAATATEPQASDKANSEPQPAAKKEEPEPEKPIAAPEPAKTLTLQEVLKNHQPDNVLKEVLGADDRMVSLIKTLKDYDPKLIGFIQAYQEGKHGEYLQAMNTDYTKMTSEELMRHQIRKEYPKASDKALEVIYEEEVIEKYKLDPEKYSEAEVERGRLLLDAKVEKYRDDFISSQEQYLLPKAPEPKAVEPPKEEAENQIFVEYENKFKESPSTKTMYADKKVYIGEGANRFGYNVDPKAVSEVLYTSDGWLNATSEVTKNADGSVSYTPKSDIQNIIGAIALYGMDFLEEYAKHYKSIGGNAVIEDLDNAKPVDTSTGSAPDRAPTSPAEAMARGGVINPGGSLR